MSAMNGRDPFWKVLSLAGFRLLLGLLCASSLPAQELGLLLAPDLADGFDFPVGGAEGTSGYTDVATKRRHKSWHVDGGEIDALYLEARETWNSSGGADTDANQPVHAMGAGRVVEVKSREVWLEHRFLINGQPQHALTGYTGVQECTLKPSDVVKRRQHIARIAPGTTEGPAQLKVTLKHLLYSEVATWPMSLSAFIRSHRQLLVPAKQERIVIAVKHDYQLHVCEKGKVNCTFPIALGQDGRKRKTTDGDNRTPAGDYVITQKALGPFDGDYGAYLGAAWLRLNYPNAYDARAAMQEGRITSDERDAIVSAAKRGGLSPIGTSLGGGIGIHGWISDWPDGKNHLTWGCLSLRKADLLKFSSMVGKGTRVVILP